MGGGDEGNRGKYRIHRIRYFSCSMIFIFARRSSECVSTRIKLSKYLLMFLRLGRAGKERWVDIAVWISVGRSTNSRPCICGFACAILALGVADTGEMS